MSKFGKLQSHRRIISEIASYTSTLTLIREVPEETIVVMPGTSFIRYAQTYARIMNRKEPEDMRAYSVPKKLKL